MTGYVCFFLYFRYERLIRNRAIPVLVIGW